MTSQKQIQLTGHIDVPPHRLDEISAALPEHIRLTRLEAGCISFDVSPDPQHAGRFNVAEIFANRADFDQHQTRTKASDWARITEGIPRSYRIHEIN